MPSPNEITVTSDLQQKLDDQANILNRQNDKAITDYEQELSDWKRNKDLYVAAKQPVPPKPPPPKITTFDKGLWLDLFMKFHLSVVATIGKNIPSGHFDGSAAFKTETYVSPNDKPETPKAPPPQPLNPIGMHIKNNRFHPAPGDTRPNGDVYEPLGEGGPKFIKTVIESPFGSYRWWEQVA